MLNAPNVQFWLSAVALGYLAIGLVFTVIAWKLATRRRTKVIGVLLVLGLFLSFPISGLVATKLESYAFQKRYEVAAARFAERCKTAGEKIIRTVDNVDGIFVMKMRSDMDTGHGNEKFASGAAFFHESTEEFYLNSFLWFEEDDRKDGQRGRITSLQTKTPGYHYLDYVNPLDGTRYRYRVVARPEANYPNGTKYLTERSIATDHPPRYGVTFDDLVDPEDREHWIAGSIVRIIDLQSNQEIARHTRFAFDRGLGGQAAHRLLWASPQYCPSFRQTGSFMTRHFVDRVLVPRK